MQHNRIFDSTEFEIGKSSVLKKTYKKMQKKKKLLKTKTAKKTKTWFTTSQDN